MRTKLLLLVLATAALAGCKSSETAADAARKAGAVAPIVFGF